MNALTVAMAFQQAMWWAAEHGDKDQEVRCHEVTSALIYLADHGRPLPPRVAHAA